MRRAPASSNDQLCGMCSWRPRWLQKLADHRLFVITFAILAAIQGTTYAYFYGILTTLEKTFGMSSQTMGFILSGNDICQLIFGAVIAYVAGRRSRPAWLAIGLITSAASCFMFASAQLLWDGSVSVAYTSRASPLQAHALCVPAAEDGSRSNYSVAEPFCNEQSSNVPVLVLLFAGQLISGIGSATIFALGVTYMDDSVKKSDSPLYLAIGSAFRSVGPIFGYIIASVFLKIYIDPQSKPKYETQDPRWLGAWWIGFLVIGTAQLVAAFPVLLFPKQPPLASRNSSTNSNGTNLELLQEATTETLSVKDFITTMKRIVRNPYIIFYYLSTAPLLMGSIGHLSILPKYLEASFGQTSSQSSFLTGTTATMMMMVGCCVGGLIIWKFKPSAFIICIMTCVVQITDVLGLFVMMSLKCDNGPFDGVHVYDERFIMTSICSQQCDCAVLFDPVCLGSQNYLSPCSAGCTEMSRDPGDKLEFRNCTCAPLNKHFNSTTEGEYRTAQMGYCPGSRSNCESFWPYLSIYATMKFFDAAASTGVFIVFLRSMDQRDKSIAMALGGNIINLLGFIPAPIVYGAIADSTCMLWGTTSCGRTRNCWLYDVDTLRYWYHGATIICFIAAALFQFASSIYSHKINMYSDDPPSTIAPFWKGPGMRRKHQKKETNIASGQEVTKALL